mgnify:CR=1 FL=1
MSATTIDELVLEELPPGLSKLQLELGQDGLGRSIRLPVLAVRGTRPGPVVGITAALHGNELNGIPVVQRLLRSLDPTALRGTVVGVTVVNVPGFLTNERNFQGTWDLNHLFPGKARGNAAEAYVHRFIQRVIRRFDVLVDLHTASFGRVNSLYVRADMTTKETARMSYLMRPQIIVHNPPNDRTLRGHACKLGIPAITVEIGNPQRYHGDFIGRTQQGVRAVLADLKMVRARPLAPGPEPVLCRKSEWIYTDSGGLLQVFPSVTELVAKGAPLAELVDPWGDVTAQYVAPYDAVVVGRSVNPVSPTGARIAHLGRLADPDDPRFVRRS